MKSRQFALILGDLSLLSLSLYLALYIRYLGDIKPGVGRLHVLPFSIIFFLWILSFYIANLYSLSKLSNFFWVVRVFAITIAIDVLLSATYFYINPEVLIAPKTVLALLAVIFVFLFLSWRFLIGRFWKTSAKIPFVIIGNNPVVRGVEEYIKKFPQVGYKLMETIKAEETEKLKNLPCSFIVISPELFDSKPVAEALYSLLKKKITVMDLAEFCEMTMGYIPLKSIDQLWFLRNLKEGNRRIFDIFKRASDIIGAMALGTLLSPVALIITILIKTSSKGPLLYRQERVGTNEGTFTVVKFRTMVRDAEQGKAQWAVPNDPRITKIGKLIRKLRLDEIPQLWNILIGEMSFVGPRPERPEFVEELKKIIPFYKERLLLKPGLSGWAQVNYPYTASIEDSVKKLEYDLYYLKNRSPLLDLSIVLKTIYIVLSGAGT